jgi:lipopolysaccharide export system permease protein
MKIITRYVLSELLQVFLVALAALTIFMLVVGLVKEAQQQGLGMMQILALIPYVLPEAMRFAVPGTMLFAVASVFGRMSASNEITALKAAGITPMATIWPAALLAVVVSLVSVCRVVIGSVEEIIYGRLRQQRSYSTAQLSINVKGVDGRRLVRPTLSFQPGGSSPPVTVSAAEAALKADASAGTLTITCRDGTVHVGDVKAVFPDTIERVVPLDAVSRKGSTSTSPSEIAMAEFPRARTEQIAKIDQFEQIAAGKIAMGIVTGQMELTLPAAIEPDLQQATWARSRLTRIIMEPWRRWANGFSCLCFVLVGAPMAIRMRNADFLTSFFLCFLPILLVYYPVFMLGVSRVKAGTLPPPAVWMGNVLVALWGLWLLRSVIRR